MRTRLILLIIFLLSWTGTIFAQSQYPGYFGRHSAPTQMPEPAPAYILKQGLKKLVAFVAADPRPNRMQAVAFLEREIVPYFDFSYMARWAAGARFWERMGEAQQQQLVNRIKRDFLSTLATRLTGFGDQKVEVQRARRVANNEVVVEVVILNAGAYPAKLRFRFYRATDGWKVFDVAANGSSAVMHYRKQFRRLMRQEMVRPQRQYR